MYAIRSYYAVNPDVLAEMIFNGRVIVMNVDLFLKIAAQHICRRLFHAQHHRPPVFKGKGVITSYSIHYTKLYESEPYDAAVVDIMLPGRDGLSLVREMRREKADTPVIFLSARGGVEDRVKGLETGGDDYLV